MFPLKFLKTALPLILGLLSAKGLYVLYQTTLRPWPASSSVIQKQLPLSDEQKLEAQAPDLAALVKAVNNYPETTRFYFVPSFADSGNTGRQPWYIYILTRYFAYPRIIACHDSLQYAGSKNVYLERFIGNARTWYDVEWVRDKHINIIILMRNNRVDFLPVHAQIGGL